MRILVVEDDKRIREFITRGLEEENHRVDVASDGERGMSLALSEDYDLIILDLLLPGTSGQAILEEVRERGLATPVIVLTAIEALSSKVGVLDQGADDYMTKPFSYSELSARIRALLRRCRGSAEVVLRVDDLEVDPVRRRVVRSGKTLDLTKKEFDLLYLLAENRDRVLSRRTIAEQVWDEQFQSFSNVIDVHINRLRRKVDTGTLRPLIHTIRGVGYVLRDRTD